MRHIEIAFKPEPWTFGSTWDSRAYHAVIDLSDLLGYAPPWANDDIYLDNRRDNWILRSDLSGGPIGEKDDDSVAEAVFAILAIWDIDATVGIEGDEEDDE